MKRKLWGVILIIVGLIIALNVLGVTDIDLFFDGWWTLLIIVPSFIGLFNEKEKTGNIIGLVIGFLLLLSAQNVIEFELIFKLGLPIILILVGLSFIFKDSTKKNKVPKKKNDLDYVATFSGQTVKFEDEEFKGCNFEAIFGGIKCDLTNSKIENESIINACAIFGGINIIVPDNVKVIVKSTSIFGGVENKHNNMKDAKNILYIDAICLFGGVEIHDTISKDN